MSIVNTGNIINLLRPGLKAIEASARLQTPISTQIFKKNASDKNFEIETEVALTPLGREKPEGTEVAYESVRQTYLTTYVNRSYALGLILTREAIDDNLYKKDFPMQTDALKNSMMQLMEVNAASVLNNAFDTNYPIGDGQAFISTAHPLANGVTQSNGVSVAVGLNETAVQDFITQINKMRAASGLFDDVGAQRIIVPQELSFNAERLLQSQYRPATANNDIGVIPNMQLIPKGYINWKYLTSPTAWFIQTDATNGLKMYDRKPLEMDMIEDNSIKAIKTVAYQRYSFGVTNFRSLVGTAGVA